jgi:hypothetical protein
MLTADQLPYTGPYYGPASTKGPNKGPTAKALKRALIRLKYFDGDLDELDEHYNRPLQTAMSKWQRSLVDVQPSGQYGRGSWDAMRRARVLDGPHKGEYAMDGEGRRLIKAEWKADQLPTTDDVRSAISNFCNAAETAEAVWTYNQQRPYTGIGRAPNLPHVNDCSSYVILAYHWAKTQTALNVSDPSGHNYDGYGNTWDNLDGHQKVSSNYLVGDLAHYDGHVTICRKPGSSSTAVWSSMGSDAGPDARALHYRDDLLFVVRPPLAP